MKPPLKGPWYTQYFMKTQGYLQHSIGYAVVPSEEAFLAEIFQKIQRFGVSMHWVTFFKLLFGFNQNTYDPCRQRSQESLNPDK